MNAVKRTVIAMVVLAALAVSSYAKKVMPTLENLVAEANLIVVGKVVKVHEAGGVKIAEANVIQTYKGNSSLKRVYYLASPTWTCDTSTAIEGETALLFLSSYSDWRSSHLVTEQSWATRGKLAWIVGNQPFFSLANSGSGRLPFTSETSYYENAQLSVEDVIFPDSIEVIRCKKPNSYEWSYDHFAAFSATRHFIGQTLLKLHNKKTTSTKVSKATL
jgi:hypothetical protein